MFKPVLACLILLASTAPSGAEGFAEALEGKLVRFDSDGEKLARYNLPAAPPTEYFLIYFSAHWCAPCRRLTPALAGFYKELKEAHPEVELIFVSADRDPEAMGRYAAWARMPWPALAWDERESVTEISSLRPRSIPYMAMLDAGGNLLGASDTGGFNIGIPKLLNALQERLGMETYDVYERHGSRSHLVPIAYSLAALAVLVTIVRRVLRKRGSPPPPDKANLAG